MTLDWRPSYSGSALLWSESYDAGTTTCSVGRAVARGLPAQVLSGATVSAGVGRAVARGLQAEIVEGCEIGGGGEWPAQTVIDATTGRAVARGLPAAV